MSLQTLSTVLTLLAVACTLACCASSAPRIDASGEYNGPPARMEATDRSHVAVFTAPTGGWRAERDEVREEFDLRRAFVTLRKPGPDRIVTQALVDLHVDTTVSLAHNVEVYARVVVEDADAGAAPYTLAASAGAGRASPAP